MINLVCQVQVSVGDPGGSERDVVLGRNSGGPRVTGGKLGGTERVLGVGRRLKGPMVSERGSEEPRTTTVCQMETLLHARPD